jgi:hypothetical protein
MKQIHKVTLIKLTIAAKNKDGTRTAIKTKRRDTGYEPAYPLSC